MKLIVQVPCLDEADTLPAVLADLPASLSGIDVIETLVIDDGSRDGTAAVALASGATHVIRHTHNRGLAAAFASGLEACRRLGADIVVNTDGDHQYRGDEIGRLIGPILAGRADVAVGDRSPSHDRNLPRYKRWLHRIGRRVLGTLAGRDLPDPVSGFRAYSSEAVRRTQLVTQYSYTIESLLQAVRQGLAIEFVPVGVNCVTRPSRLFRSIPQFVYRSAVTALRVSFMHHPVAIFGGLGVATGVTGLVPIGRFLVLAARGASDGHVQSLVLGSALIVLAAVLLIAGMLAELIAANRCLFEELLQEIRPSSTDVSTPVGFSEFRPPVAGPPPPRTAPSPPVWRGFTLIELMVVLSILSLLLAMLMPAVQRAREAMRRTQCDNHLRQLSLAVLQHDSTHRHLPSGGWGKEWSGLPGLGSGARQPGGWIYQILPQLEQEALQKLGGTEVTGTTGNGNRLRTPLSVLHCPSRRGAMPLPNQRNWQPRLHPQVIAVARNDYAANGGGRLIPFDAGPADLKSATKFTWPDAKDANGIVRQRLPVRLREVIDGLSQTFLLGEKHVPFTRYGDGKDRGDNEGAYSGDDRDTIRYVGTVSDSRYQPFPDSFLAGVEGAIFGSVHPTGFTMSFCDGSVRHQTYSIDLKTYANLGARDDRQVINADAW